MTQLHQPYFASHHNLVERGFTDSRYTRSQIVSHGIEAVVRLIRARLENSKIRDARLDADWALIRRQRVLTLRVEINFNVEIIVLLQVGFS